MMSRSDEGLLPSWRFPLPSGRLATTAVRRSTVAAVWLIVGVVFLTGCQRKVADAPVTAVPGSGLPSARSVRFVKLEALSEWNGKPWASVAEFNLIDATGATVDRKKWLATADSAMPNGAPGNAIDGDPSSYWHTPWEGVVTPPPHALTIDLGGRVRVTGFRYLARQDKLVNGTIAKYRFFLSNDGVNWGEPVATGDFANMSAPRTEKTVIFAAQTENHPPTFEALASQKTPMGRSVSVRLVATDPDGDALTFEATGLPAGLVISPGLGEISGTPVSPGTSAVNVTVSDNKGGSARTAFDWVVMPPAVDAASAGPGEFRFVRLEEVSEVEGRAWASVAEFNLVDAEGHNLARGGWTAIADSAGGGDKPGNAIDGNAATFWHSQWDEASPPPPHSLIVDLGRAAPVRGFRYLPRQDKPTNGMIAEYRFYTSADGVSWGAPRAEGDFRTIGPARSEKTVMLK